MTRALQHTHEQGRTVGVVLGDLVPEFGDARLESAPVDDDLPQFIPIAA